MKLAIQEALLLGDTLHERLDNAKSLGVDGIEFNAIDLTERIPSLLQGLAATGLRAAAVNIGGTHLLHPSFEQREAAIVNMRQAMIGAIDLGASGVVFIPTAADTPRLPDLHPYKSAIELEAELLVTQLRATLCDFAYAVGTNLYLAPVNEKVSHLIRQLDHAHRILEKNDFHPHLKIAPNTYHMTMEEVQMETGLHTHADYIGYVQLMDVGGGIPGTGDIDFASIINNLAVSGYGGWLTVASTSKNVDSEALSNAITLIRGVIPKSS